MRLKLWVSTPDAEDLDLFITLHKLDKAGREIFFYCSQARCLRRVPRSVSISRAMMLLVIRLFAHKRTVNRGRHRVHCGGEFDSQLVIPWIIPS